jgi:hypothetical protein
MAKGGLAEGSEVRKRLISPSITFSFASVFASFLVLFSWYPLDTRRGLEEKEEEEDEEEEEEEASEVAKEEAADEEETEAVAEGKEVKEG